MTNYFSYFIFTVGFYWIWALADNYFPSRKHPPGKTLNAPFSKLQALSFHISLVDFIFQVKIYDD